MAGRLRTMHTIIDILPMEASEEDLLERAASLSYLADFSIAETLVAKAKDRGLRLLSANKFELVPGKGARALIDGMQVRLGSPKLLIEERIAVPVSFAQKIKDHSKEGNLVIIVLSGRSFSGAIILGREALRSQDLAPEKTTEAKPLSALQRLFGTLFRKKE